MQNSVAITSIPTYLMAENPEDLRRLMLETNLKHGIVFKYFDIQEMQNGEWIVWYFVDININNYDKSDVPKGAK